MSNSKTEHSSPEPGRQFSTDPHAIESGESVIDNDTVIETTPELEKARARAAIRLPR